MGKFVIVVVIALVIVWWLRGSRRAVPPAGSQRRTTGVALQAIVPCAHCGVHLPRAEAVAGAAAGAFYCTEAHRLEAERR